MSAHYGSAIEKNFAWLARCAILSPNHLGAIQLVFEWFFFIFSLNVPKQKKNIYNYIIDTLIDSHHEKIKSFN